MTACADVAQAMLKELAGSMPRTQEQGEDLLPLIDAAIRCDVLCSVCDEAAGPPPVKRKDLLPAKDKQ